jgi:hypothetical protein
VGFLEKRIREFVFALAVLFGEDALGILKVYVGPGFDRGLVREHRAKHRIHNQLGLAAGAGYLEIIGFFLSHSRILPILRAAVTHDDTMRAWVLDPQKERGTISCPGNRLEWEIMLWLGFRHE